MGEENTDSPDGEVALIFGIVGVRIMERGERSVSGGETEDSDLARLSWRGFTVDMGNPGAAPGSIGSTKPSTRCTRNWRVS